MLDAAFPQKCLHAFIPAADATAQLNTRCQHLAALHRLDTA